MLEVLDPPAVRQWSRRCADALGRARADIDALNVFPVPDGDTGTNLHLTMLAAAEALDALPGDADLDKTWRTLAHGALLGARGNSGVIVSQAVIGLAEVLGRTDGRQAERRGVDGLRGEGAGADGLGVDGLGVDGAGVEGQGADLRDALLRAAELARAAVARPVEGTVLSVLTSVADAVRQLPGSAELAEVARLAAEEAGRALRRTTDQLDVLADNGVVDAGAAGLVVILAALDEVVMEVPGEGHEGLSAVVPFTPPAAPVVTRTPAREPYAGPSAVAGPEYEVMLLLDADRDGTDRLRAELDSLGDSLVIVGGDDLWNVHVHVADAGAAIEAALAVGRPHRIRVTYLGARAHPPEAARGVVAVAAGDGLAALFRQAGAVAVRREPGSSPPLAAVLAAIREAGTEVAVLPNDSGVRAVAVAAARIARDDGVIVSVLPTKASVQGLAALAVHDPSRRFDDDVVAMTDAAGHTRHGHVWIANREAMTSAGLCRPGDVLGVVDGDVALIGTAVADTAVAVTQRLISASTELVTLVIGADAPESLAGAVQDYLGETRPDIEIVRYEGGQGGYPLLIGVE